jgi:mono/diheme cytochrome c family protein
MFGITLHSPKTRFRLAVTAVFALCVALLAAACRGQQTSVVTESKPAPAINPAAANNAPPAGAAAPQAAPTLNQPVGPMGQTPTPLSGARKAPSISSIPLTTSAAKPSPTPTPDLRPRPTPPPETAEGKIVQQWQAPPEAAKLKNPVKGQPDAAKTGMSYYMQRCEACHGKDGRGQGWMAPSVKKKPTDLTSRMVQANTDGELWWKITNGRSPMPAHKVRFDDEQRWYIVTFLRTLK